MVATSKVQQEYPVNICLRKKDALVNICLLEDFFSEDILSLELQGKAEGPFRQ
jgi:hypothetical protein